VGSVRKFVTGNKGRQRRYSTEAPAVRPSASISVCAGLQGSVARESALHIAIERLVLRRSNPARPQVKGSQR